MKAKTKALGLFFVLAISWPAQLRSVPLPPLRTNQTIQAAPVSVRVATAATLNAPTNVAATVPQLSSAPADAYQKQGRVSLAWQASPDATVVGYRIYYGRSSGNYTQSATLGKVTRADLAGLDEGVRYYFAVSARDADGLESLLSNEVAATTEVFVSLRFDRLVVETFGLAGVTNQILLRTNLNQPNPIVLKTFVGRAGVLTNALFTNGPSQAFFQVRPL